MLIQELLSFTSYHVVYVSFAIMIPYDRTNLGVGVGVGMFALSHPG